MPTAPTYPGVYIEEVPSGVRTITGVATSVAAFVDAFRRGPMNEPLQVFNLGDFERLFGGLDARSEASYAIQQFFLNGGTQAWVVRTASGAVEEADVAIQAGIGGATALTVAATNPGVWGNGLRVVVDWPGPASADRFNLTVLLFEQRGGAEQLVASEVFNNLSMAAGPRFVATVVNDELTGSKLVRVTAAGATRPQPTGTLSGVLAPFPAITAATPQVAVTIGSEGTAVATLAAVPTSLSDARARLETAIRAARPASRAFAEAQVSIVDDRLRILAGPTAADARVTFGAAGTDATAADLGLLAGPSLEGALSEDLAAAFGPGLPAGDLRVTIGATGPVTLNLGVMADLDAARDELEAQILLTAAFAGARVLTHVEGAEQRLLVLAGTPGDAVSFTQEGADTTVTDLGLDTAAAVEARVSEDLTPVPALAAGSDLLVTIGGDGPHSATITTAAATLAQIANELQTAVRAASAGPTFAGARVAAYAEGGENRLAVLAGVAGDTVVFAAAPADATTVAELLLDAGNAAANVQSYRLGAAAVPSTAQGAGTPGNDGDPPDALALIGDLATKTGIFALEDVDLFNLLCIPRAAMVSGDNALDPDPATAANQAAAILTAGRNYCESRRAFLLVDTPNNIDEVQEIREWLEANANLRHKNAALYFPRVLVPDPLDDFRLREVGAGGTMAGLYARTDATRGVWKAPAGTEATLTNVQQLDYLLSDAENGVLNPLAINCLRTFPVYGRVAWGARTLEGADQQASEWKYVPVRRLALYVEESLYRGTQWVVFEPNDEPLWAQIRLNVGAFMQSLFLQGAFQGSTPRQAYLVKCDHETTTQDDVNRGIVNILVGFAPLKPAEFVILKIQQLAGQIQA
jgi:phage tail sheath protein FI